MGEVKARIVQSANVAFFQQVWDKAIMIECLYLSRCAVLLPCRYADIDYTLFLPSYNPLDEGIKRAINSVRM